VVGWGKSFFSCEVFVLGLWLVLVGGFLGDCVGGGMRGIGIWLGVVFVGVVRVGVVEVGGGGRGGREVGRVGEGGEGGWEGVGGEGWGGGGGGGAVVLVVGLIFFDFVVCGVSWVALYTLLVWITFFFYAVSLGAF